MAGESPDKSEQRKSSGETAPGERDPRLAVFRESAGTAEPEGSDRVDQPTAVFKLPPEEPPTAASSATEATEAAEAEEGAPEAAPETPEGDARLRAAVAAWVATADTPDDAEGAGEDAVPEAEAAAADRPGARAAAAAEARADAPTAERDGDGGRAAAAAREAEEAPATGEDADEPSGRTAEPADGQPAAAPEAGAETDAPGATRTAAAAEAPGRAEQPVHAPATDADGDEPSSSDSAAAAPRASADASGAGRAGGRACAAQPAAARTEAEQQAEAGDSRPTAAAAEARGDARTSGPAEVAASDEADANANTSTSSKAAAEPPSGAGPQNGPRASGVERAGGRAAADPDVRPEVGGGPRGGSDGSDAGRESGRVAAGDGAGDRPVGDAGSQVGSDDSGVSSEGGRASAGGDGGRPVGDAGSQGGSGVGRESGRAAGGVDSSGGRPVADAGVRGAAGTGRAADGGDGRSVTGGDGPSGRADEGSPGRSAAAGRGAEQAGGAVDQATAVFKAVRPRQAVDQPTTALKAVGGPKSAEPAESAAERTSQFVPLKRDDVRPSPARPRSTPAASPAAPPAPAAAPASAPLPEAERTRQQPLPPRPPLDLLAELTNTPPPPETPVRTAVRRVKIWTPLVLLLVIVFAVVQFLRPLPSPTLALTAKPTYTFGGDALNMPWPEEGQSAVEVQGVGSIGTHGEQKPWPIASVTKAMTAYVILKEHPLTGNETGPKITVDAQAEKESKYKAESTASIREGQQFTERQMLQLLMVPSGNNAARLLARWDAKSEEEFVRKMNDAAKDLGMKNTTYTDPSGLEATTVSTATDQLKLAKAVMENDVFREIVNLPEVEIPGIDGKIYNNNNILLKPGVSGIKTGSSTPAGGNLLWSANTIVDGKERRIVGAVMGQEDATTLDGKLQLAISKSLKLIQAAQRDVTSATVVKKGEVVGYVDDGLGGQTPVVATKDLKAVGWPGLKVELAISDAGKPLPHAAKAGDEVGQVTVGSGPGQVKAPVALQKDLIEPGFGDKLTRVG